METIVITGVTGFIGSQMLVELASTRPNVKFILPIRAPSRAEAIQRYGLLVQHFAKFSEVCTRALREVEPSIMTHEEFLLGEWSSDEKPDWVIHCAADTEFSSSLTVAREHNVYATTDLIWVLRRKAPQSKFVYVSTAFVCGRREGYVSESLLSGRFHNAYEHSKYEGEAAVKASGLSYLIVRPSVVVGRFDDGYTKHFRVFYSMFRMWLSGAIPRAPIYAHDAVDLIPVDVLCRRMARLMKDENCLGSTCHIVAGKNLTNARLILKTASEVFELREAKFSPRWVLGFLSQGWMLRMLPHRLEDIIRGLQWHFPYLGSYRRVFLSCAESPDDGEGDAKTKFENFGSRLFRYCLQTHWGKRPIVKVET